MLMQTVLAVNDVELCNSFYNLCTLYALNLRMNIGNKSAVVRT